MARLLARGVVPLLLLLSAWMAFAPAGFGPAPALAGEETVSIVARKFTFTPSEIVLAKGQAVVLELTSQDRLHGFNCPGLGIRADVQPGQTAKIPLVPATAGRFPFSCDVFCGGGHEEMSGVIVVKE